MSISWIPCFKGPKISPVSLTGDHVFRYLSLMGNISDSIATVLRTCSGPCQRPVYRPALAWAPFVSVIKRGFDPSNIQSGPESIVTIIKLL